MGVCSCCELVCAMFASVQYVGVLRIVFSAVRYIGACVSIGVGMCVCVRACA